MNKFIAKLFEVRKPSQRRPNHRRAMERLDARLLMAADIGELSDPNVFNDPSSSGGSSLVVPIYDSNPDASKTIYLDFDGHQEIFEYCSVTTLSYVCWDVNAVTPRFNFDTNTAVFDATELDLIEDVWKHVAEDFAPFNVNVTTDLSKYESVGGVRVAIGGEWNDWFWKDSTGVEFDAGKDIFGNPLGDDPNTVWVFSDYIGDNATSIGTTASHEAGHHFGLAHQSSYHPDGSLDAEYDPGTADWTPIMGYSLDTDRTTWAKGRNIHGDLQDDMAILANKLGYSDDVHDGSFGSATPLTVTSVPILNTPYVPKTLFTTMQVRGEGIIQRTSDVDTFSFTLDQRSDVTINVGVADVGANLDMWFELKSSLGIAVASANPNWPSGGATVNQTLSAGEYYVVMRSDGVYGDVGQYFISGTIAAVSPISLENGHVYIDGTMDSDRAEVRIDADQVVAILDRLDTNGNVVSTWQSSYPRQDVVDAIFHGHDGNDRFYNFSSLPSVAYGHGGADYFVGGVAKDRFFGGDGHDQLRGNGGHDELDGGDGNDRLFGGAGNDTLNGNAGRDWLYGQEGNDLLYGESPAWPDVANLFGDNDYLDGGSGDDVLKGFGGNDTLKGGSGLDHLDGGFGNDHLDGAYDQSRDVLVGGKGSDNFVQHYVLSYLYDFLRKRRVTTSRAEDIVQDFSSAAGDTITRVNH